MQEFSVAVVGLGKVGREIAEKAASIKNIGESHLSKIYLCPTGVHTKPEDAALFAKNPLSAVKAKGSRAEIEVITIDDLLDARPAIVVNSANNSAANRGVTDRRIIGINNLELNRKIAKKVHPDSLYLIVSNHPVILAEDSVITCGRDPELTTGLTHIDTLRGRAETEHELRKEAGHMPMVLDLSDIFIIGNHDPKKMILATNASVNHLPIRLVGLLKDRFEKIENGVEEAGPLQMQRFGDTNKETAKAVEEVIAAAINGKDYVTAAVLCGPEHTLQKRSLYLAMKIRFDDLRAVPDWEWFNGQDDGVKKRFYSVAKEHELFMDRLRAEGKIKGYAFYKKFPAIALPEKIQDNDSYSILLASGPKIIRIGRTGTEKKETEMYSEGIRKIGYLQGRFYATFRKSVVLGNEKFSYCLDYSGNRGINSVETCKKVLYAAHSELGLLASDGNVLKRIFFKPARNLLKTDGLLFFISKNSIINCESLSPVYTGENELATAESIDGVIFAAEAGGELNLIAQEKFQRYGKIRLPCQRIYCSGKFENGIAFGTDNGVVVYYPKEDTVSEFRAGKTVALACKNSHLFAAGKDSLKNPFLADVKSSTEIPLPPGEVKVINSICIENP